MLIIIDNGGLNEMLDIFLGEFLGLLVFVVVHGGILASMVLTGKVKEGLAAFAVFLGISFGVYVAFLAGSGAHINPAVTMAVFASGGISFLDALVYIGSQILGGFVGGLILFAIYLPQFKEAKDPLAPFTGNPNPKDTVQNVITSVLGSFFLAFFVLTIVTLTTGEGGSPLFGFAVGAAVTAAALAFGGTSFSMLNVARDLGPRLTAAVLKLGKPTFILPLLLSLASLVGGALAGLLLSIL
jgi:glycerol uptake facilitator protein